MIGHDARFVRLSRAIGLACVAAIIVLSLLPGDERPHTGASGQIEHAIAYFGTAVFLALGFRTLRELQRSPCLSGWLLCSRWFSA